ncbi:MAG: hypothetical protein NXH75_01615 [Halobacteriovoraceae bacterium]|nr:hypothetical protein [Halobacteriovoraceae bacterium]
MKALLLITLLLLFVTGCNGDKESLEDLAEQFNSEEGKEEVVSDDPEENSEESSEKKSDEASKWSKVMTCTTELDSTSKCIIDAPKGHGIVDFEILDSSSSECFLKGAVRVSIAGKQVRVKKGCELSLGFETALIEKKEYLGSDLYKSVQGFGMGAIILPKKLKKGLQLDFVEIGSNVVLSNDKDGVGIKGGAHAGNQLNYDPTTGEFEALGFSIPTNALKVKVTVSRMFAKENTGEQGVLLLLDDKGNILAKRNLKWGKKGIEKNLHTKTVGIVTNGATKAIVLPIDYKNAALEGRTDSSDFYLQKVKFIKKAL